MVDQSKKKEWYTISSKQGAAPVTRRDRIVVSTLRCGRSNPGSNPGHGIANTMSRHKGWFFGFVGPSNMHGFGIFDISEEYIGSQQNQSLLIIVDYRNKHNDSQLAAHEHQLR